MYSTLLLGLALSVGAQMRDDHERHSAIGLHASKDTLFAETGAPGGSNLASARRFCFFKKYEN